MLLNFEEEIKLLQRMLREPEVTPREKECLTIWNRGEVHISYEEINDGFCFQTDYMLPCTKEEEF